MKLSFHPFLEVRHEMEVSCLRRKRQVKSVRKYDTGRGSGITKDAWEWLQRMKVAPLKQQKQVDKDTFEKLLEVQRVVKTPKMSKDEFVKALKESEIYGRRRKYRTLEKTKEEALEWFSIQEDAWWTNEEMKILLELDRANHNFRVKCYKRWQKEFINRCQKIYHRLIKEGKEKLAKEFIDEAYKRMMAARPKRRSEVEQAIITRIRRLTIQRRYYELQKLMEELRPLLPLGANGAAS